LSGYKERLKERLKKAFKSECKRYIEWLS